MHALRTIALINTFSTMRLANLSIYAIDELNVIPAILSGGRGAT